MEPLNSLVVRARDGDIEAFGRLVGATQMMAFAAAVSVLRDAGFAQDAVQEAYIVAFRRLRDLDEPAAFLSWLRRIVITTALNARRARPVTLLRLDDVPEVPRSAAHDRQRRGLHRRARAPSYRRRQDPALPPHAAAADADAIRGHAAPAVFIRQGVPRLPARHHAPRGIPPGGSVCLDERARVEAWQFMGLVLRSVSAGLPGLPVRITPTEYPMCSQAWDVDVEAHGRWWEVTAYGVFTDRIVQHLGADPSRYTAVGVGYGLERFAMLRYGIDDIRKVDVSNVA